MVVKPSSECATNTCNGKRVESQVSQNIHVRCRVPSRLVTCIAPTRIMRRRAGLLNITHYSFSTTTRSLMVWQPVTRQSSSEPCVLVGISTKTGQRHERSPILARTPLTCSRTSFHSYARRLLYARLALKRGRSAR